MCSTHSYDLNLSDFLQMVLRNFFSHSHHDDVALERPIAPIEEVAR